MPNKQPRATQLRAEARYLTETIDEYSERDG